MPGRSTKGRKAKSRTKAAKVTRGRSSKSKKSKTRKTTKAAKRKTGRKQTARGTSKTSGKSGSRASSRSRQRENVLGESTASREFRRDQTGFVRRNRGRVPQRGERAGALEGSEGNELRTADEIAHAHSAGDED
ncbi:MAG TPA: hypothetical protein VHT03_08115 [Rhizomicrobium sp.]|jgi:hypothetical protein|nr:hypothetical protein [Rhizomicrobium sp.]